ncbi:unnamed protein product [Paramecium sonneborni]|uniref:Uncharacterized protein n=1 Tax=Paramecium sonneborni TaxID=65129 RepID=A0A8S1JUU1_9CILI|nr:unnamed protein product [Paramecium sonneborni]
MDKEETDNILRIFGVTEINVTKRLYEGLIKFYDMETQAAEGANRQNCCTIYGILFQIQNRFQIIIKIINKLIYYNNLIDIKGANSIINVYQNQTQLFFD